MVFRLYAQALTWVKEACLVQRLRRNYQLACKHSAASSMFTVENEQLRSCGSTITNIVLNHPPVNSLNASFTSALTQALRNIEASKDVKAIIIKSSLPNIFCAGLDLHELHGVSREQMMLFWKNIQDLWYQIYSSKLVTMSLINGHCLAAGTIIAAACDYRIGIEGQYSMGVTAAKIGLVAPPWFLTMLCHLMGQRTTEHALQIGRTFLPNEAVGVGLIDQVCTKKKADETCSQVLTQYLSVSQESRSTMKQYLRAGLIKEFEHYREADMNQMVDYIMSPTVQSQLGHFIQKLKQK